MELSKETSLFKKDSIKDDIQTAGQGATSYITKITNDGIFVHQTDSGRSGTTPTDSNAYGVHISDDIDIIRQGEVVASYGSEAIIGKKNTRHVEVKDGGMQIYGDSTNMIGQIGWGSGINESGGLSDGAFFTLGGRVSGSSIGNYSSALGTGITASGFNSHAEGMGTQSIGNYSHAEGRNTKAFGPSSHAEGVSSEANGDYSHASGEGTKANGRSQTAIGKYNEVDTTSLFIIGKGSSNTSRSNAMKVDGSGNITIAGNIVSAGNLSLSGTATSEGTKLVSRSYICYANSRVNEFNNGVYYGSFSSFGITTGSKPVGILLTHQDGGVELVDGKRTVILRYDYDFGDPGETQVCIMAYHEDGTPVSGNVRYFAVVFQHSWVATT